MEENVKQDSDHIMIIYIMILCRIFKIKKNTIFYLKNVFDIRYSLLLHKNNTIKIYSLKSFSCINKIFFNTNNNTDNTLMLSNTDFKRSRFDAQKNLNFPCHSSPTRYRPVGSELTSFSVCHATFDSSLTRELFHQS